MLRCKRTRLACQYHGRHGYDALRNRQAMNRIRDEVDPDANIIFEFDLQPELEGRVSVVATGIDSGVRTSDDDRRPIHECDCTSAEFRNK